MRRVGFTARDNGLRVDVLPLAECGFRERLTLIESRHVMKSERVDGESKVAEICRLEECVQTTETDAGELYMASVRVDKLTAKRTASGVGC